MRGPLDLIKEEWEEKLVTTETSVLYYIVQFREKMQALMGMAKSNLKAAEAKQKLWYDRSTKERTFKVAQKVLVLNYVIARGKGRKKHRVYHVNMLKAFHDMDTHVLAVYSLPEEEQGPDPLIDLAAAAATGGTLADAHYSEELTCKGAS